MAARFSWIITEDDSFVREVPAVFELVEQCYRQYLWTGNPAYLKDPVFVEFLHKSRDRVHRAA